MATHLPLAHDRSLDGARSALDARQAEIRHRAGDSRRHAVAPLHDDGIKSRFLEISRLHMAGFAGVDFDIHHHEEMLAREEALQFSFAENMPDDVFRVGADRHAVLVLKHAKSAAAVTLSPVQDRRAAALEPGFADMVFPRECYRKAVRALDPGLLGRRQAIMDLDDFAANDRRFA